MYPIIAFKLTAELMLVKVSASKSTRLLSNLGKKKHEQLPHLNPMNEAPPKAKASSSHVCEKVYESH